MALKTELIPTAAQALWRAADEFDTATAVIDVDYAGTGLTVSYAELRDRAARVAAVLEAMNLRVGDRIALLLDNSIAYIETYFGAVAAGLVVVPLNVRLVEDDYRHMLRDSNSRVLVSTAKYLDRISAPAAELGIRVVRADVVDGSESELDSLANGVSELHGPVARDAEAPATLMYTSGTTGLPKAVVLSDRAWWSISNRTIEVLKMAGNEVIMHAAPLTHGAGFLLLPTITLGGENIVAESFEGARMLQLFEDHQVTGTFLVPSMIRMLLDAMPDHYQVPNSLKRVYYAGSPIDPHTFVEAVDKLDGRLIQSFAQMESPMYFTVLDEADHLRARKEEGSPLVRSAGRILEGVALRIIDDDGNDLAAGEAGEILAKAPQMMSGYWNRPEATASTIVDGWLHTGDIGYLDDTGYLYVVDRKKDMIVTGGSNVYAREVEDVLADMDEVREAAVIGLPHRIWGESVTAVLVAEDRPIPGDEIIQRCRERLAGYRVPKTVIWVDGLPRNAYGKVLKRKLRDELGSLVDS